MDKLKKALKLAGVCFFAVLILIFPAETAQSTVKSIDVCLSSIIPSMFAFMVLSSYVISSGLYKILSKPLMLVFGRIIKTDECTLAVFILSLFGGYPVGAKLMAEIISQNKSYHAIAEKAAMFSYCISPSFAIIMIGTGVFGSVEAGFIIYISNVAALMITAAVVTRIYDMKSVSASLVSFGGLTEAVSSSARSLFTICSVIVAFNTALTCVSCLLKALGAQLPALVLGFFEISNLLGISEPSVSAVPVVCAAASTGGLCVLMQTSAIIKDRFSKLRFFAARIPCAILSGIICQIILSFHDISVTASAGLPENYTFEFNANKAVTLILAAMCIIIFNKTEKILKKV